MGSATATRWPDGEHDRLVVCFGGPQVRDGDRIVRISGHAGRILAALVARRQGVSIDQLIDVVWPDGAPDSARAALHVHMGRLRKLLAQAAGATGQAGPSVVRHGTTYSFDGAGWAIDVDLFQDLRQRARAISGLDSAGAIGLLSAALQLASGSAFVVDGESVAPSATHQLALARLDVEEEFVEALIADGRMSEAERVAVGLVEAEPFRERRWSLLMRAQALQSRTRDALATYQRARRRLVDSLGLEPSEDLQRTQLAVLSNELSSLRAPDTGAPEEFQLLPQSLGSSIGRDASIERVEAALLRNLPVVVVGAPGAGKTRLAVEVARRARARGLDVAWLDLRNVAFAGTNLGAEVARWIRRHPAGLVVVDNAETDTTAAIDLVAAVRRSSSEVGLVVTSRVTLPIEGMAEHIGPLALPSGKSVDEIEASPAVMLLRELLALRAPRANVDSELAAQLVARVGGLPLGIRLVADLSRSVPPADVLTRTISTLVTEIEPALEVVLSALGPACRAAFAAASVVPGQMDAALIGSLVGVDGSDAVILQLCDNGLLQFDEARPDAPYSMLEPLRDVGARLLAAGDRQGEVFDRFVRECVHRSQSYSRQLQAVEGQFSLRVRLDRELPWHRQAIQHLAEIGESEPALRIAAGLEWSLYALGWWRENVELQDAALAIPGAATSTRAQVYAARGRPGLLHELSAFHTGRALEIAVAVGDRRVEAKALTQLGIKHWWDRDHDEALDALARSLEVARLCRDAFLEQEAYRFSGIAMVSAGRAEEGFAVQLEVLDLVERSRHAEVMLPHVHMYLGHCRRHVGDDDAAFVDLEQARVAYEKATNQATLVHVYAGLAEMSVDRGDVPSTLRFAGRGLELSANGAVAAYDPWMLCTLARAHAASGDDQAARHASAAAVTALAHGWRGETHRVAVELASVALQLGDRRSAGRLIGLADVTEDRRDLPFVSPSERARADVVRAAVAGDDAGDDGGEARAGARLGAGSTLAEAASRLISTVGA